jgi:beta-glucosidase
MKGRTYKYFSSKPLYAFGYGLSYTSFDYGKANLENVSVTKTDTIRLTVTISNAGKYDGDEVVQVYFRQPDEVKEKPVKSLVAFERVNFRKGESKVVSFSIPVSRLRHYNQEIGEYDIAIGNYELLIGAASDDIKIKAGISVK